MKMGAGWCQNHRHHRHNRHRFPLRISRPLPKIRRLEGGCQRESSGFSLTGRELNAPCRQSDLSRRNCRPALGCSFGRLPKEPHPPRRAHDIFARSESVIVGYYTLKKCIPRPAGRKRERRLMARNDGIDRTSARNVNLTAAKISNAQRHNEREKESYTPFLNRTLI